MSAILTRREFGGLCIASIAGIAAGRASHERQSTRVHFDELELHQIVETSAESPGFESALLGARVGADEASRTAQLLGGSVSLSVTRATGLKEALSAAREFAAAANVAKGASIILIHASPGTSNAISNALGRTSILRFFTATRIRDSSCHPLEFDLAPSLTMRADALSDWLEREDPNLRWETATDGSAAADVLRARLQHKTGEQLDGSAAPSSRSRRAIIVLAQESAVAPMIAELHSRDPEVRLAGPVMELPAMLEIPAEARVGNWVVTWIPALEAYGAGELNQRYADATQKPLDGHAWSSWFAVKIASEAVLRARTGDPLALGRFLESSRGVFDGHKGTPMSFRPWDQQLRQPLYISAARSAEEPDETLELVSQEPPRQAVGNGSVDSLLDQLGSTEREDTCAGA